MTGSSFSRGGVLVSGSGYLLLAYMEWIGPDRESKTFGAFSESRVRESVFEAWTGFG